MMVLSAIRHLATLTSDAGIFCFEKGSGPENQLYLQIQCSKPKNYESQITPGNWMSSKKNSKLNTSYILQNSFEATEKGFLQPVLTSSQRKMFNVPVWTFLSFGWLGCWVSFIFFFNCQQSTSKIPYLSTKPQIRRMVEISARFTKIIFHVEE